MTTKLPHAKDAEMAIIGGLLVDNTRYDDVRAVIDAEDFFDNEYRKMFVHIGKQLGSGKRVDILTMTEDGFNPAELARMATSGSTLLLLEYADRVRDRSLRRLALSRASALARASYEMDADIEEALEIHVRSVREVGKVDENIVVPIQDAAGQLWDVLELLDRGLALTTETPWKEINTLIGGFIAPELIILAARPSMGKSQWAIQVADSLLSRGLRVLFHDMETDNVSILRRMALMRSGVDWMKFRLGIQDKDDVGKLSDETVKLMETEGMWLIDKRIPVDKFRWIVRRLHRDVGLDLVIVDYLQLYPTEGRNRVQEVGHVASTLKEIAKENNIPVLATCQLRRINEREDKKPTMDDLRESGEIEQAADLIIGMHRPGYYNPMLAGEDGSGATNFMVLKARDGVRGTDVNLYWAARRLRFEGVTNEYQRVMDSRGITSPKGPAVGGGVSVPPDPQMEIGLRVAGAEDSSGVRGEGSREVEQVSQRHGEIQHTQPDGVEAVQDNVEDAQGERDGFGLDVPDSEPPEDWWDR